MLRSHFVIFSSFVLLSSYLGIMSRTGYFGVMAAALENGCPSTLYHVTCWDTPEKAAVGFLRGRAKEFLN